VVGLILMLRVIPIRMGDAVRTCCVRVLFARVRVYGEWRSGEGGGKVGEWRRRSIAIYRPGMNFGWFWFFVGAIVDG